jgi:sterol desaturase/sphingolipid hydroxylase (fatty acid hydroxylase superfamily)
MYITVLHILSYDIWFYLTHILLHTSTGYSIHKIHHKTAYERLTYLDTDEGHSIESVGQSLGVLLPFIYTVSFTDFALASIFLFIRGHMRHDHRCSWLIGNHHLLHHKYPKYNFGEYWLDSLFRTKYPNNSEYIYGIIYI